MNPLDRLLYVFLSLPVELMGAIVLGKVLSDLLAGLLAIACLIALFRPIPGLRTKRRAGWCLALAVVWVGAWLWVPVLYSFVGEAWQRLEAIPAMGGPEPPPPPPSPAWP